MKKIIVACHKPYKTFSDALYTYLEVGADLRENRIADFVPDNTGDNISCKNKNYCELTGLYWAWKNLDAEYLGLCHYRRYFGIRSFGKPETRILTGSRLDSMLQKTSVILPKPRNYFIETNYSQYVHAHHAEDLDTTRAILEREFPEYLPAFDESMRKTTGHRFNMFIMRRDILDSYCSWLFTVLFRLEQELDISQYDAVNARVFGYVSERLLDVWLQTNKIDYLELPVVNLESQHWVRKGCNFLLRKVRGKHI